MGKRGREEAEEENTKDCMRKRGREEAEEKQHEGLYGEEREGGSRRETT